MNKIYYPIHKLLCLVGVIAFCSQAMAQVAATDSLALVDLYNRTNGNQWINNTNWFSGNVPTWYGITVSGGRVTRIDLEANNLNGPMTDSLFRLTALKKMNVSHNKITKLPTLTTAVHFDSLVVNNNLLSFRDLVPNRNRVDSFIYAPQDSLELAVDTTVYEQFSVLLTTAIDQNSTVTDNYEWFFGNASLINGASNAYNIACMDSSRVGMYYVKITNFLLPKLTLYRKAYTVRVRHLSDAGLGYTVCADNGSLQAAPLPAGTIGIWSVVSGSGTFSPSNNPIANVSNLAPGANVFRWSVTAGNGNCPAGTFSNSTVTVVRDAPASAPDAGPDQSVCSTQAILGAATPAVGSGVWTVTKGTGIVAQPTSPTSAANNLSYGENIFRWKVTNGTCVTTFFDEVKVYRDDTLKMDSITAGANVNICPTEYDLSAALPANTSGVWSVVSGAGTFSVPTATNSHVSGLNELDNILRWTVSNTCNTVYADVNVHVYNFTTANAGPDRAVFYSPINRYTVADSIQVGNGGSGIYTYVWAPTSDLDNATAAHPRFLTPDSGSFTYSVTVTDSHGCTATDAMNFTVIKKAFLDVPTLFTPNGDGVNDELYIPGIESYINNELTILDRNNQVVYHKVSYRNDWKGTNEDGLGESGLRLAADTYYYVLKLEDGKPIQKGYFLIKY
jgi:gliding motility-associated-like protein